MPDLTQYLEFGWTWIEGEDENDGDEWIQISPLVDGGFLGEELCVIMFRSAKVIEHKFPDLRGIKERQAELIVNSLNEYAKTHELISDLE